MIAGLQKMTLLDFPGKVACTVFLGGCNYRCPFCHNTELFTGKVEEVMSTEAFLVFLEKRRGLLDGVCVSGGEPTLCPELEPLLKSIKALGFLVKLDTNGSRPKVLKQLVDASVVDYVAMDVKNCPRRYAEAVGLEHMDLAAVEESLRFLIAGSIPYELRTTLVKQLHDTQAVQEMGQWLAGLVPGKQPHQLFLQSFVDRDTVAFSGLCAPEENEVLSFADILTPFIEKVTIRNL